MEERGSSNKGLPTRGVEIAVALLTFAFGALVAFASYRLGSRWGADGPEAGYFPFYIGSIICIASIINLIQAATASIPASRRIFVEWGALRRVFAVLVPAALFVIGIYLVGMYVSALLYIAAFMIWIGKYSWHKGLAVGFGVSFTLFLMFEVWFKVLLPKGVYNVLSFVGT
ncbi:MAG: tripartite tricarboxylate transporter TctB family protein [Betaproteobacteria bacterium]|nr:tripartite tricarboxylate transporter TctB family protein [Betaproteobacteria bacterium]